MGIYDTKNAQQVAHAAVRAVTTTGPVLRLAGRAYRQPDRPSAHRWLLETAAAAGLAMTDGRVERARRWVEVISLVEVA